MKTLPPLYLITDGARVGEARLLDAVAGAGCGGLSMLQIREKHLDRGRLEELVARLRKGLPPETTLTLGRREELVRPLDLDGVHLGGDPREIERARATLPPPFRVGYSAHTLDEISLAEELGADYVSLSPIFPPTSKQSALAPLGVEELRRVCASVSIPVYALGGVTPESVPELRRAGASGVAVIGAILDAPDPEAATRAILGAWNAATDQEPSAGANP